MAGVSPAFFAREGRSLIVLACGSAERPSSRVSVSQLKLSYQRHPRNPRLDLSVLQQLRRSLGARSEN